MREGDANEHKTKDTWFPQRTVKEMGLQSMMAGAVDSVNCR